MMMILMMIQKGLYLLKMVLILNYNNINITNTNTYIDLDALDTKNIIPRAKRRAALSSGKNYNIFIYLFIIIIIIP